MWFRCIKSLPRYLKSLRRITTSTSMTVGKKTKGNATKWVYGERSEMLQQLVKNRGLSLPAEITISDGEVAVLDWYQEEKHFSDVCKILKSGSEENIKGIQTDEFPTEDDVRHKIENSKVVVGVDKNSGLFVGGCMFFRSPLARSTEPTHTGGFILVNPNYRGKGIAEKLLTLMAFLAIDMGYIGLYGRVAVIAKSIVPSRRAGANYFGIIPNSIKVLDRDEWLDDLVTASDLDAIPNYKDIYQNWLIKKSTLTIPPLHMSQQKRDELNAAARVWNETLQLEKNGVPFCVETPNANQLIQLEEMIKLEAEDGGAFAMDEFTDDGFFNRQLLRNSQDIVITERPGGEPIAAAIIGQSAICRMISPLAGGYILVKKEYRRKEIGNVVLAFILEEAERQGFKGFLSDVFPHCGGYINFLLQNGFFVTGSMPKVAFVKGQGLTHSLILFKDFGRLQNKMLPSKI